MKLQFTDARITEYYEGGIHELNDGEPFDVPDNQGEEMLKAIHFLDDTQVPVFERVDDAPAVEDEADATDEEPDEEPLSGGEFIETADALAKAHSREDLEKMARKAGLDGDSYTNKKELAQAIIAANATPEAASEETETDEV